VDLVIAGDGPERERLAARARQHGVADRVHLVGTVDRATVGALLRGATLVAMPSRSEGHPLVALEAMQVGAPLVVADLPGMPPALRHDESGWRVPPEDAAALGTALGVLLRDADRRRRLGAAARAAALLQPRWDDVAHRIRDVYVAAAGQTRS
jgi:glycosyltransferase involved in cell wall biosynthesis